MPRSFNLRIPASSANIGPGFDVLGLGLEIYLEIRVSIDPDSNTSDDTYNCKVTYEGEDAGNVPLSSDSNLITKAALYILRCHQIRSFPLGTHIHILNPIPLGRGLGSSAAAIVGGILLGNEIGSLKLTKGRLLDYCLLIERHPDNIAAALLGGFVGSYLNELSPSDTEAKNLPLEYILPKAGVTPKEKYVATEPPSDIAAYVKYNWNEDIKCVTIIPDFELETDKARALLPSNYSKQDIVFNLQRLAVLTTALTEKEPNHKLIYEAMKDKIHQPYRTKLIPGLQNVLDQVTPNTNPGLCGICLSGAGPTILCLATDNFETIADNVISIFKKENIFCDWKILDLAHNGAQVEEKRE